MTKQTVVLRPMFFVESDVFTKLSTWERAMSEFYAAYGIEMEKVSMMGAGEGEPIYVLRNIDDFDKLRTGENAPKEIKIKKVVEMQKPLAKLRSKTK